MLTMVPVCFYAQVSKPHEAIKVEMSNAVIQTTKNKTCGIVVNMEMIKRFNSITTEGDIYSWSQLMILPDSRVIQVFLEAYSNYNPDHQTMQDILMALEEKNLEIMRTDSLLIEDEYFTNIRRIKEEINNKLRSGNAVASK